MKQTLTEDEVRQRAKKLVFGNDKIKNAVCGVGQITAFNTLGKNFRPKNYKTDCLIMFFITATLLKMVMTLQLVSRKLVNNG